MSPVRILIADDQELVRTGFRMILDEEESLSIVGEAATACRRSSWPRRCGPTSC